MYKYEKICNDKLIVKETEDFMAELYWIDNGEEVHICTTPISVTVTSLCQLYCALIDSMEYVDLEPPYDAIIPDVISILEDERKLQAGVCSVLVTH